MADAIQLASAVTSLISATCIAIDYLVKLKNADTTARELIKKVRDLQHLLRTIEPVVKDLDDEVSQTTATDNVTLLKQGIHGCIQGCHSAIEQIVSKLKPFDTPTTIQKPFKAILFTFNEREIKAHQATIEGHLQRLQLLQSSLMVMNDRKNDDNHFITHDSLSRLRELILFVLGLLLQQQQQQQQQQSSFSQPPIMGIRTLAAASPHLALPGSEANRLLLPMPITEPDSLYDDIFNHYAWNQPEQAEVQRSNREVQAEEVVGLGIEELSDDSSESVSLTSEVSNDNYLLDTPLAAAVKLDQAVVVKSLVDGGCDIEDTDSEEWTYLHHAVWAGSHNSVAILLQGARDRSSKLVDATNKKGQTALILCAQRANLASSSEIARILLEYEADVNIEDRPGRTALHHLVIDKAPNANLKRFATLLVGNGARLGVQWEKNPRRGSVRAGWPQEVDETAGILRRRSSAAMSSQYGTSPETGAGSSPGLSTSGRRKLSWIKRRMSGNPGTIDT